jgi:hypothetical protein
MRPPIGIFCVLALSGAAAPSRADWQYTKWGMSPEEVCAASRGAVTMKALSPKDAKSNERLATLASGEFAAGKFKFTALFEFNKKERKLEKVSLLYTATPDEPPLSALLQALQEKYGPWSSHTVWIDNAANYSVDFSTSYGIGFLTYEPLHQEERKGL